MTFFKKPSAIFGVSSVVIAAIIGGFFIRNKIISDNLYAKFLADFEINRKKQIKIAEENISEINKNLNKNNYEKNNLNKKIKKNEQDIKNLTGEISKLSLKISELSINKIRFKKSEKIISDVKKTKDLKTQISTISSKMIETKEDTFNEENNLNDKLKNKLSKTVEIFKKKKKVVSNYIDDKKRIHKQLKNNKQEKINKENQKLEIAVELQNNKISLISLETLIKELLKNLSKTQEKLKFFQNQTPPQNFY